MCNCVGVTYSVIIIWVCIGCSISMSDSRQLLHRWSMEELKLATGRNGVTHLQHHLKLCSAYSGVPVWCFNLATIFLGLIQFLLNCYNLLLLFFRKISFLIGHVYLLHHLKLCIAYSGLPVWCFNLATIFLGLIQLLLNCYTICYFCSLEKVAFSLSMFVSFWQLRVIFPA